MRTSFLRILAVAALSLSLARCGGGGGGGGSTPPPALRITTVVPADGSNDVATNVHVVVTFSEPLDASSVGPQSIRVGVLGEGDVAAAVGLVLGSGGTQLEFSPTALFAPGTQYAIFVSKTLRSATGDALGGTTQFLFRTAGGAGGGVVLPPASALRATSQTLRQGRRLHTATLLGDGRVLLCGGYTAGTSITDKAEVFTPASESFALLTGRMAAPRANHAAVRLADGRVLLCGGYREVSSGTLNSTETAEIFDPSSNTFAPTSPMASQRVDHAATLLPDGRVLVTGGSALFGANLLDLASAELFDPANETWSPAPHDMVHTHATHAALDLGDGRILVVGGSDTDLRPELYTIATGVFAAFAAAPADSGRFGAAVARYFDGDVTVVGGESEGQVLHFDRPTSTLSNTGSPTTVPRSYATASPIGPGRMLVAGGIDFSAGSFVLASCDLVAEGGVAGSTTYATTVRFPTGMAMHTATVLADGRVLFAGGLNPVGGQPEYDGAYLFTP